jgi:2-iminobutanoate/2-iminopropanoate deaminase
MPRAPDALMGEEEAEHMAGPRRINAEGLGRLPAFSHASVAGDFVYVSGTLGTKPDSFELVDGGMGPQTRQTLENIRAILEAAGATLADLVKVNVFVTDMGAFREMNAAYLEFFDADPPARITVGCSALALGALVEIDAIAHRPS